MFAKKALTASASREILDSLGWLALLLSSLILYGLAYSWLGWVTPGSDSLLEGWRALFAPWH